MLRLLTIVLAAFAIGMAAAQPSAPSFTAAQAEAGRAAYDVRTLQEVWSHEQRAPSLTGVLWSRRGFVNGEHGANGERPVCPGESCRCEMMNRREFLGTGLGLGAAAIGAYALPGDKFRWACTSGMFRVLMPQPKATLETIAAYGFHGLEATAELADSAGSVAKFKEALAAHHLGIATFWGGGVYFDESNPGKVRDTIQNNIRLARDYVAPCGGKYLKVNLTNRGDAHPTPNWMTPEQMRTLADTLNDIGRGTREAGVKFAFHPHAWTMAESDREVRQLMALTDPALVYLIADTAHLTLGGMDPVKFVREWYPRIAGVHLKDTEAKYSVAQAGWRGPAPSQEEHARVNLYKNFGAGGVDFAGFVQALRDKGYDSWISLDFDPLRPGEGKMDEIMSMRRKYLLENLKATLRS